jgi:hypothetical protein
MRHWLVQVLITIVLFTGMLALNVALFKALEFAPGISWIYLPAGMRLLCTLLFAEAGAVGLLIVSWLVSFEYFFPNDFERAFMGGLIATAAPYLVYLVARHFYGLDHSLRNLTSRRLLVLAFAYSVSSPLLHHLWFASRGQHNLVRGFVAMFVGDLTGTLIVLYALKGVLALLRRRSGAPGSSG